MTIKERISVEQHHFHNSPFSFHYCEKIANIPLSWNKNKNEACQSVKFKGVSGEVINKYTTKRDICV